VNLISSLTEPGAVSSIKIEDSFFIQRLRRLPFCGGTLENRHQINGV